jgi:hypothetical protein
LARTCPWLNKRGSDDDLQIKHLVAVEPEKVARGNRTVRKIAFEMAGHDGPIIIETERDGRGDMAIFPRGLALPLPDRPQGPLLNIYRRQAAAILEAEEDGASRISEQSGIERPCRDPKESPARFSTESIHS